MSMLKVENLHKSFGNQQVLKGIDFTLEKGDVLSIIGSSGSGKTTLLRCLNFLERGDQGRIYVDGKCIFDAGDLRRQTEDEIRSNRLHFGMVFQSFNLFPQYSVLRNITLAPELLASKKDDFQQNKKKILEEINENALALLERVDLLAKKDAYPGELSGGQQQRVAIARTLAMKPEILCFDEPTSALDPELTGEVLRVIRGLKSSESTMIVVTHEIEFARGVSDKVIFMADGVIAEEGTPEEVIGNPKNERTRTFLASFRK